MRAYFSVAVCCSVTTCQEAAVRQVCPETLRAVCMKDSVHPLHLLRWILSRCRHFSCESAVARFAVWLSLLVAAEAGNV